MYFNRVRHISLFTKKSMWIVVLGDKLREDLFRHATYDEEQAKAFVNTMLGLSGLGASVVAEAW